MRPLGDRLGDGPEAVMGEDGGSAASSLATGAAYSAAASTFFSRAAFNRAKSSPA